MKCWSLSAVVTAIALAGCGAGSNSGTPVVAQPKNVLFFLGDGMGLTTMTAARIYKVGEDGEMTMDTLPETAFVKTFSADSQVTDSAPSMGAYMTGVKTNNAVVSMSAETTAYDSATLIDYVAGADTTCPTSNGKPAITMLELAKAAGMGTGVVSTARITHATPAAAYAHICHRDGENTIAAQMVPGGSGFNTALGDGMDVVMGGGLRHFLPKGTGSSRTDSRDLVTEMKAKGYSYATNKSDFDKLPTSGKLLGLFTSSHMAYDLDRNSSNEPSLADMTSRSIDQLKSNPKGFFLMVEGGRIDHALHETTARKALQDTVAFDEAIKAGIDKMRVIDPDLKNTLIVVTADHDHTLILNGYAARTGKTTDTNPGVLGLLRNYLDNTIFEKDTKGNPYTIIGFGNGENRPGTRTALTDTQVFDKEYHQEATIPTGKGSETHGGGDVFLGAIGKGADNFSGVMDNTAVFGLMRKAIGL